MTRWLNRRFVVLPAALAALAASAVCPFARAQDVPPPPPSAPPPPPPSTPPQLGAPAAPPPGYAPAPRYVPPAYARRAAAEAEVRFEPDDPSLSLLQMSGRTPVSHLERYPHAWYIVRGLAPVYSPICAGPCTAQMGEGTYRFAVAKGGGRPIPAGAVPITGPATLHAEYDDRSAARVAGLLIGIGGLIGGAAMIIVSADSRSCDFDGYCHTDVNGPLLAGGIGVIVASSIVGAILASERDEARIFVAPLATGAAGVPKESAWLALDREHAGMPQGLAVGARF